MVVGRKILFQRANRRDQLGLLFMVAVAHVDAEGVGAGEHQLADHLGRTACRAERREHAHLPVPGRDPLDDHQTSQGFCASAAGLLAG